MGIFSRKKNKLERSVTSRFGRLVGEEYVFADDADKVEFARSVAEVISEPIDGRIKEIDDNTLRVSGRVSGLPVRVTLNHRDGTIVVQARTRRAKEFDDANLYLHVEHDSDGASAVSEQPDADWDEEDDRKVFFSEHMCIEYAAEDIDEKRALFERLPADLRQAAVDYLDPREGTFNFAVGTVAIENGVQLLAYKTAAEEAARMTALAAGLAQAIDRAW